MTDHQFFFFVFVYKGHFDQFVYLGERDTKTVLSVLFAIDLAVWTEMSKQQEVVFLLS